MLHHLVGSFYPTRSSQRIGAWFVIAACLAGCSGTATLPAPVSDRSRASTRPATPPPASARAIERVSPTVYAPTPRARERASGVVSPTNGDARVVALPQAEAGFSSQIGKRVMQPSHGARGATFGQTTPPAKRGAQADGASKAAGGQGPSPALSTHFSSSPAVVALAQGAVRFRIEGDHAHAAASLERALRIEPRNARLWYELARVRCQQQRYSECESMAQRSSALDSDVHLDTATQRLISSARRGLPSS
ncbi:MAG: hypothetical protein ACI8PT_001345 [Gammaproteobacteria bacterium]|jgi:hypothetical protein